MERLRISAFFIGVLLLFGCGQKGERPEVASADIAVTDDIEMELPEEVYKEEIIEHQLEHGGDYLNLDLPIKPQGKLTCFEQPITPAGKALAEERFGCFPVDGLSSIPKTELDQSYALRVDGKNVYQPAQFLSLPYNKVFYRDDPHVFHFRFRVLEHNLQDAKEDLSLGILFERFGEGEEKNKIVESKTFELMPSIFYSEVECFVDMRDLEPGHYQPRLVVENTETGDPYRNWRNNLDLFHGTDSARGIGGYLFGEDSRGSLHIMDEDPKNQAPRICVDEQKNLIINDKPLLIHGLHELDSANYEKLLGKGCWNFNSILSRELFRKYPQMTAPDSYFMTGIVNAWQVKLDADREYLLKLDGGKWKTKSQVYLLLDALRYNPNHLIHYALDEPGVWEDELLAHSEWIYEELHKHSSRPVALTLRGHGIIPHFQSHKTIPGYDDYDQPPMEYWKRSMGAFDILAPDETGTDSTGRSFSRLLAEEMIPRMKSQAPGKLYMPWINIWKSGRPPTLPLVDSLRAKYFGSLIQGVNGVWMFTIRSDFEDLVTKHPEYWAGVEKMSCDARALEPLFLAPTLKDNTQIKKENVVMGKTFKNAKLLRMPAKNYEDTLLSIQVDSPTLMIIGVSEKYLVRERMFPPILRYRADDKDGMLLHFEAMARVDGQYFNGKKSYEYTLAAKKLQPGHYDFRELDGVRGWAGRQSGTDSKYGASAWPGEDIFVAFLPLEDKVDVSVSDFHLFDIIQDKRLTNIPMELVPITEGMKLHVEHEEKLINFGNGDNFIFTAKRYDGCDYLVGVNALEQPMFRLKKLYPVDGRVRLHWPSLKEGQKIPVYNMDREKIKELTATKGYIEDDIPGWHTQIYEICK